MLLEVRCWLIIIYYQKSSKLPFCKFCWKKNISVEKENYKFGFEFANCQFRSRSFYEKPLFGRKRAANVIGEPYYTTVRSTVHMWWMDWWTTFVRADSQFLLSSLLRKNTEGFSLSFECLLICLVEVVSNNNKKVNRHFLFLWFVFPLNGHN